jgi:predicted transcriptional regulator
VHAHRDRVYIRKDVLLNLEEFGELNQSQLMSYCGLNNVQHKPIIDELVEKGLIIRFDEQWGERNRIIKYRISEKGKEIARAIFKQYELLFPRSEEKK